MSEESSLKTIFLFGAGASRDAGIPTIQELTSEFVNDPIGATGIPLTANTNTTKEDITILSKVAEKFRNANDIEVIMSLILRLEDKKEKELLEGKFPELKDLDESRLSLIKDLIQSYIRKKCEDIKDVEYLWPLEGMSNNQKLNIFTLNYDATIEIFCEKKGIKYTDGFEPDWNPERFDDKNMNLNLFKLHGSLYWFRTKSNKTIKVPMKGLQASRIKYLTDEEVSEMMIYPTLEKNKQLGVYSWLSQKFKDMLNQSDVCVIMGYSFRDSDIKESIIESLSSNPNLWLVIANPHASDYKDKIFDGEVASRIVTMNMNMSQSLTDRNLNSYLESLSGTRQNEEKAWKDQSNSQTRSDYDWSWILRTYLRIGHHDRVKWLVEELSQRTFQSAGDNFPNCVEAVVGSKSLQYALEYVKKQEPKKLEIWKKIFFEYCLVLEYGFFENSSQTVFKNNNPVTKDDLPWWYDNMGSQPRSEMKQFHSELKEIQKIFPEGESKKPINKIIETLDLYLNDNGTLENTNPDEIIKRRKEAELGLKRWSNQILSLI
ncbi:MAG: SIR2 family protein [Thaumarchaeota archaeon]|nr:SIR2 family protein [Nitrososphaerota archaeon]